MHSARTIINEEMLAVRKWQGQGTYFSYRSFIFISISSVRTNLLFLLGTLTLSCSAASPPLQQPNTINKGKTKNLTSEKSLHRDFPKLYYSLLYILSMLLLEIDVIYLCTLVFTDSPFLLTFHSQLQMVNKPSS